MNSRNDNQPPAGRSWEALPDGLRVWAPAKINLDLLVGPPRADGFHPLDSLVAKISLYDQIVLRRRPAGGIGLLCRGADCGSDDNNLALRAARLLAQRCAGQLADGPPGLEIVLTKHIPPGKGLGGGSSDAAAVLQGVCRLWGLTVGAAELAGMAAELGSDVPLFLGPPSARMTGRGEIIEPLAVYPLAALLVLPDEATSTAQVYRQFDVLNQSAPRAAELSRPFDLGLLASPPSAWRAMLRNDLTDAAMAVCPALRVLRERLGRYLGEWPQMTGSGSAMFVLFDRPEQASHALGKLPDDLAALCRVVGLANELTS